MAKVLRPLALVLLWLSATVTEAAFPAGTVLCYGADGHLAIEPVHADSRQEASQAPDGLSPEASAIRAADCTDVPVGKHLSGAFAKRLTGRSAKRPASPPAFYGAGMEQPRLLSVPGQPAHGACPESPASPHLAHLQTVALRL